MSAYILGDTEIATLAASLEHRIACAGGMTGRLYRHRHDDMVGCVSSIGVMQDRIDTIAFHLLRINTLSVNARYKGQTPIRYDIGGLRADREENDERLLELIGRWLYQSCEAEHCRESQVYRLMEDWEAEIAVDAMHSRMRSANYQ